MIKNAQWILLVVIFLSKTPSVLSTYAGFRSVDRGPVFSPGFSDDERAAERAAQKSQTVEPFLKLFDKYKKPVEVAELEFTLSFLYSQRTGLIDTTQALVHVTNALQYNLPERARVEALNRRAGCLAHFQRFDEALKDRLRSLLICSYRDLPAGMPKVEAPNVTLYSGYGSDSPENQQHIQDYSYYREQMNLQSELVMCRYGAVHAVKRMNLPDEQILKALKEITPDSSRHGIIMQWLKSENPFPRPPPAK